MQTESKTETVAVRLPIPLRLQLVEDAKSLKLSPGQLLRQLIEARYPDWRHASGE